MIREIYINLSSNEFVTKNCYDWCSIKVMEYQNELIFSELSVIAFVSILLTSYLYLNKLKLDKDKEDMIKHGFIFLSNTIILLFLIYQLWFR